MSQAHEFPYEYIDSEDQSQPWLITFTYTPGQPGVYNALPENCYPDEPPEIEIHSIISQKTNCPIDETTLPSDLLDKIEAEAFAYLDDLGTLESEPSDYSFDDYN